MTELTQHLISNALLILAVALLIILGAVLIQRARRDAVDESDAASGGDPLSVYRTAFERGQMDEAEYQRIVEAMGHQGGMSSLELELIRARQGRRGGGEPQPEAGASPPGAAETQGDADRTDQSQTP